MKIYYVAQAHYLYMLIYIQRASLSRRADGLFNCQACAYGCAACVKSERVLSSKMRIDACVKFED
jgi:hypothetical protein